MQLFVGVGAVDLAGQWYRTVLVVVRVVGFSVVMSAVLRVHCVRVDFGEFVCGLVMW